MLQLVQAQPHEDIVIGIDSLGKGAPSLPLNVWLLPICRGAAGDRPPAIGQLGGDMRFWRNASHDSAAQWLLVGQGQGLAGG